MVPGGGFSGRPLPTAAATCLRIPVCCKRLLRITKIKLHDITCSLADTYAHPLHFVKKRSAVKPSASRVFMACIGHVCPKPRNTLINEHEELRSTCVESVAPTGSQDSPDRFLVAKCGAATNRSSERNLPLTQPPARRAPAENQVCVA